MPSPQKRRIVVASLLVGLGAYILFPTPDELVIHPTFAALLYLTFHVPLAIGLTVSFVLYRVVGVVAFIAAVAVHRGSWLKIKEAFNKFRKKD